MLEFVLRSHVSIMTSSCIPILYHNHDTIPPFPAIYRVSTLSFLQVMSPVCA
jgi:hypothetical protein